MTEQNSSTMSINDDVKNAVKAATDPAAIRQALVEEAERQLAAQAADKVAADAAAVAKAAADKATADAVAAAAAAASKTPIIRKETIDGQEFTFEGESDIEVERMVTNALKVAAALRTRAEVPAPDPAAEEAARVAAEQAAAAKAAAKVELEVKFKRGEISTQEYIEQSGAITDYLDKHGIPLEDLKSSVEANRLRSLEQSWEQATNVFKTTAVGSDWPGGAKNLEIISTKLQALGLADADDKVAALAQAYSWMKQNNMIYPADVPADAPATPPAAPATVPAAPAAPPAAAPAVPAATAAPTPRTSSSLFGASSGTFGAGATERAVAKQVEIPKDATPQEILQLWKEDQIKQGKDPNTAFTEVFSTKRA